ncbi:MAG TPA: hypothetical protein VFU15_16690, partial [Bacteroidia bacterium]|nr:hypothetical protein [Bacteroidia bacterium]
MKNLLTRRFMKRLLSFSFLLFTAQLVHAGSVEATRRIYSATPSDTVKVGTSAAKDTVNLTPKTGSFTDFLVTDVVTFGVDHHYIKYIDTAMDVRIRLHIQPYDASDSPLTAFYQNLVIKYHPSDTDTVSFVDKAVYRFTGAYKFIFTIDSVIIDNVADSILPQNMYVDGLIHAERYYDFSSNASTAIVINTLTDADLDCDDTLDQVEVSWPVMSGAEEYQLEWTFVNDYDTVPSAFLAASALSFDFRNNSTRITTTNNYYDIPLLFDHGYIIFRVRAIGRDEADPTQIIVGVWSDSDDGTVDDALSSYHVTTPHEASLNWQVTTTFAEDGKKKEVISYFDGSLRNRQTVTRINSDDNVIVGETMYDHQGRPAINVLPAPVTYPA